jgi:hypothetical protein
VTEKHSLILLEDGSEPLALDARTSIENLRLAVSVVTRVTNS